MAERLDKKAVRELLEEADHKWFSEHAMDYNYQGHLEFTAEYLVKNYNRRRKKVKAVSCE